MGKEQIELHQHHLTLQPATIDGRRERRSLAIDLGSMTGEWRSMDGRWQTDCRGRKAARLVIRLTIINLNDLLLTHSLSLA